jgi:hypothetical protein
MIALLALLLAASDPQAAQSVDRVRAGLDKPKSKLTIPDIKPTFKVEIRERQPLQEIFDMPPWLLDPHGWQPDKPVMKSAFGTPMVGFDLLSLFRGPPPPPYAAWTPSEDLKQAIAKYCAAQPKDGRRILICEP